MMKSIAFRVDSSYQIGIGHVMRCITLANKLVERTNANVYFVSRSAGGSAEQEIKNSGFECIQLEQGIDNPDCYLQHGNWLRASQQADAEEFKRALKSRAVSHLDLIIVDHYGIDHLWHEIVRKMTSKILVIDDLGDRAHACDYLLDQTYKCAAEKYSDIVPKDCKQLLGTEYALLRSEFGKLEIAPVQSNSLLVMFGGTDPDNLTLKALKILEKNLCLEQINVVINASAKYLVEVKDYCLSKSFINLHVSPSNIAKLMVRSKLAIGAAGTTSWERCAAGLPTVVVIQAFNQREIAANLQDAGVISFIEIEEMEFRLNSQVNDWLNLLSSKNEFRKMCTNVCDGFGTDRVVGAILDNG